MSPDNLPPQDRSVYVQPKKRGNPFPAFCLLAIVSVIFFLVRNGAALSHNYTVAAENAAQEQIVDINADVTSEKIGDDYVCKVTNNDSFQWSHVVFRFNEILSDGEHKGHIASIAPGDSATIKASQVNSDRPFVEVKISCDTPKGPATWQGDLAPKDLR